MPRGPMPPVSASILNRGRDLAHDVPRGGVVLPEHLPIVVGRLVDVGGEVLRPAVVDAVRQIQRPVGVADSGRCRRGGPVNLDTVGILPVAALRSRLVGQVDRLPGGVPYRDLRGDVDLLV